MIVIFFYDKIAILSRVGREKYIVNIKQSLAFFI